MQPSHLGLIHIALEYKILHVGHRGYGGSIIERVAQDDGVAHLDRHIQYQSVDGAANECCAHLGIAQRDTIPDDIECITCL